MDQSVIGNGREELENDERPGLIKVQTRPSSKVKTQSIRANRDGKWTGVHCGTLEIRVEEFQLKDEGNKQLYHLRAVVVGKDLKNATTIMNGGSCSHSLPSFIGGNSKNDFGVLSVPVCVPKSEMINGNHGVQITIYQRDMILGKDSIVAVTWFELPGSVIAKDKNETALLTPQVSLRNSRGRGNRGCAKFSLIFNEVVENEVSWDTISNAKSWNLRLFIVETRFSESNGKNKLLLQVGAEAKQVLEPIHFYEPLEFRGLDGSQKTLTISVRQDLGITQEKTLDEVTLSLSSLSRDGKNWVQIGSSAHLRVVAIPLIVPTTSYLPNNPDVISMSILGFQTELSLANTYLLAQLFPLVDGESRGRAKFRDLARTSTSSTNSWKQENISIPWTGMVHRQGTRPLLHFSLWHESDGSMLGCASIGLGEFIEKSSVAQRASNDRCISLPMGDTLKVSIRGSFNGPQSSSPRGVVVADADYVAKPSLENDGQKQQQEQQLSGYQSSLSEDVVGGKSSLSKNGRLGKPGKILLELIEIKPSMQLAACSKLSIKVNNEDTWMAVSEEATKQEKGGCFVWEKKQKFSVPFQWSIRGKRVPCVQFMVQGEDENGNVLKESRSLNLASFAFCPGETIDFWICDNVNDSSKLHLRAALNQVGAPSARKKVNVNGQPITRNGKLHVHLKGGNKFQKLSGKDLGVFFVVGNNSTSELSPRAFSKLKPEAQGRLGWDEHFVLPLECIQTTFSPVLYVSLVDKGKQALSAWNALPIFHAMSDKGHVLDVPFPLLSADESDKDKLGEINLSIQVIWDIQEENIGDEALPDSENYNDSKIVKLARSSRLDYSSYKWIGSVEPVVALDFGNGNVWKSKPCKDKQGPIWNENVPWSKNAGKDDVVRVTLLNDNCLDEFDAIIGSGKTLLQEGTFEVVLTDKAGEIGNLQFDVINTPSVASESSSSPLDLVQLVVAKGKLFRSKFGRVHSAMVKVVRVGENDTKTVVGQTLVQNDGIRRYSNSTDRVFAWNTTLTIDRASVTGGMISLEVFDAQNAELPELISTVDISDLVLTQAKDSKSTWLKVSPVFDDARNVASEGEEDSDDEKESDRTNVGEIEICVKPIVYRKGKLQVSVSAIEGTLPMRSIVSIEGVAEFFKLRVEPNGHCAKTGPNQLSDALEVPFSNMDQIRDTFSLTLYCDDADLAENALGTCTVSMEELLKSPNTAREFILHLCHPITGRELGASLRLNANLVTASRHTNEIYDPAATPGFNAQVEVLRCVTIQRLKRIFYAIDKDGSESVSLNEFLQGFKNDAELATILGTTDLTKKFNELDKDKNGQLSWDEFFSICHQHVDVVDPFTMADNLVGDEDIPVVEDVVESKEEQQKKKPSKKKKTIADKLPKQKKNKNGKGTTSARRSNPQKMRNTQTMAKYDENVMEKQRIDDPFELRSEISELRRKLTDLEYSNKLLKGQVLRVEGKSKRRIQKAERMFQNKAGTEDDGNAFTETMPTLEKRLLELEEENLSLKSQLEDPFSNNGDRGGDESIPTMAQDHTKSEQQQRVRELEEQLRVKDELHKTAVEQLQKEKAQIKEELDQTLSQQEDLEMEAKRRQTESQVNKTKAIEYYRMANEMQSELAQYRKLGDAGSEEQFKLIRMKALESEQQRNLQRAYEKRQKESHAASKLQAIIRAVKERSKYNAVREQRTDAATRLQAIVRAKQAQSVYEKQKVEVAQASSLIQAAYRGKKARVEKQRQTKAATDVQRVMRGKRAREQATQLKVERQSAMLIQRQVRRQNSQRKVQGLRKQKETEENAAVLIQCAARSNKARQEYALRRDTYDQQQKEHQAATVIQSNLRKNQDMKEFEKAKVRQQKRDAAARSIQSVYRKNSYNKSLVGEGVGDEEDSANVSHATISNVNDALELLKSFLNLHTESFPSTDKAQENVFNIMDENTELHEFEDIKKLIQNL